MTTNSTAEIQKVSKAVQTLATHVLTLAKRVYAKDDDQMPYMDDDDEKKSKMSKTHEEGHDDDDAYMDSMKGKKSKMGDHDDDDYEGDDMKAKKNKQRNKGFADSAEDAKDEEDAKFGDPAQSDVDGNEPMDPKVKTFDDAGREDETLGKMVKQIADLSAMVEKMSGSGAQTIVKSMVPGAGDRHDGREVGSDMVVTRQMQEDAKGRTYQELNRLREAVGDIPRHGFLSN